MHNHNHYPLSSLSKQDVRVLIMDRRVERDVRRPNKWETPHPHPSNDPQTSQAPMVPPTAMPIASATEMMQNDPAPTPSPVSHCSLGGLQVLTPDNNHKGNNCDNLSGCCFHLTKCNVGPNNDIIVWALGKSFAFVSCLYELTNCISLLSRL
jgi:hypothetical protein